MSSGTCRQCKFYLFVSREVYCGLHENVGPVMWEAIKVGLAGDCNKFEKRKDAPHE